MLFLREITVDILIALRYLRGHGRTIIFNTSIRLSVIFMSLMVYIMVLVLSVFNGFEKEIFRLLENSGYHITLSRANRAATITNFPEVIAAFRSRAELSTLMRATFPSISMNALLGIQDRFEGVNIRALPVNPDGGTPPGFSDYPRLVHYRLTDLARYKGGNYILVGRKLARQNHWRLGDRLRIYIPLGGRWTRGTQIRQVDFQIAGFFRTGFNEFDLNIIYMSLETAQRLASMRGSASEIIVQLHNLSVLEQAVKLIRDSLPGNPYMYTITTIRDERGNFLEAVNLEKTLMMIVMGLLIIAGVAGIWVTVHLLVSDKIKSIGMLLAMGLPNRSINIIFTANALFIGLLSAIIGGSAGIYVTNNLESIIRLFEDLINGLCLWAVGSCTPVRLIPENIYYFDYLPVYADLNVIFGIGLFTMVLCGFAGYFPSRKAAGMSPVDAIRFE